jgi:TniQ
MTRHRLLPLAPRPLPGEAPRSWIGRVAARYDLSPAALIAGLQNGDDLAAGRLGSIDWKSDGELEHLLTQAARIKSRCVAALRAPVGGMFASAVLFRDTLSWCQLCVDEDVFRHGESYERAIWRLGCCAICVEHRQLLSQTCPICASRKVGFRPLGGRAHLMCAFCNGWIDGPTRGRADKASEISRTRLFGPAGASFPASVAFEMQTGLLAAIEGTGPVPATRVGVPPGKFVAMSQAMVAAFLQPGKCQSSTQRADGTSQADSAPLASLTPAMTFEMLSMIGSVLCSVGGEHTPDGRLFQSDGVGSVPRTIDLQWFVGMLSPQDYQWFRAAAREWGLTLARAVETAVQDQMAHRQQAEYARDKTRRDAAWASQAAPRLRAAAIRRIAARARKRSDVRLARKAHAFEPSVGTQR